MVSSNLTRTVSHWLARIGRMERNACGTDASNGECKNGGEVTRGGRSKWKWAGG